MSFLFIRNKKEGGASTSVVSPEQKAKQLQDNFPTAEVILQGRLSVLDAKKLSVRRVSDRSKLGYVADAIPFIGLVSVAGSVGKSAIELAEGTTARVHNAFVEKDKLLESLTYHAASAVFNLSQRRSTAVSDIAEHTVASSLDAWTNAELYKAQHPQDIAGHRKQHGLALKAFEAAMSELGIFEVFDTKLKGHFDINLPEIAKFATLGLTTAEIYGTLKEHLPEFNTYIAAMTNNTHKEEMSSRFKQIAEVTPVAAPSTPKKRNGRR